MVLDNAVVWLATSLGASCIIKAGGVAFASPGWVYTKDTALSVESRRNFFLRDLGPILLSLGQTTIIV